MCLALVCKQPKVTMSLLIILTSLAWTSSFLLVDATTVLACSLDGKTNGSTKAIRRPNTQFTLNTNAVGVYFGHRFNANKKGRHPDFSLHSLCSILLSLNRKLLDVLDIDNHFKACAERLHALLLPARKNLILGTFRIIAIRPFLILESCY